ncbi:uncharacterized protein LOC122069029 [Macadamia integrifolia]|uniref:uncharacterized protein LOC122069029 n=1 Tax=Macadamia integrifolia TaxID=60698 RepID=UPI001C502359|nr:uncharacterized protein LOC122069029 [Macadamia integrifolia]
MSMLDGWISIAINLVVLLIISIGMEPTAAREQPQPSLEVSLHKEFVQMFGYGEERVSSVLVAGSLLCDTCLDDKTEAESSPISGARVAIKCKIGRKMRKSIWARGRTDEFGDFIVHLPSRLHAIPRLEKLCFVKVLALPRNSPCGHLLPGKPKPIRLSSVGNGIRTYTPGKMRFQPLYKASRLCVKKAGDGEPENYW